MNFVWITPTYRVNIESIFSLQCESEIENPDYDKWQDNYDEYLTTIEKELPPLEIDGNSIDIKEDGISQETIDKYIETLQEKIKASLGPIPPQFICKYAIVTHTGLKIYVSEDKYNQINEIIDNMQKEKGE